MPDMTYVQGYASDNVADQDIADAGWSANERLSSGSQEQATSKRRLKVAALFDSDATVTMEWLPIETAPKDNERPLFIARFNDDGTMQEFDYNAIWESESESWEIPQVYFYWQSENGNVEEPSHWSYQPEGFCRIDPPSNA